MNYRRARFAIDDFGPFEGYTTGDRWNGWATPHFEVEVARRVAEEVNRRDPETKITYDPDPDAFLMDEAAYPDDDPVAFGATYITHEGERVKTYAIGAYYWTWQVIDQGQERHSVEPQPPA